MLDVGGNEHDVARTEVLDPARTVKLTSPARMMIASGSPGCRWVATYSSGSAVTSPSVQRPPVSAAETELARDRHRVLSKLAVGLPHDPHPIELTHRRHLQGGRQPRTSVPRDVMLTTVSPRLFAAAFGRGHSRNHEAPRIVPRGLISCSVGGEPGGFEPPTN